MRHLSLISAVFYVGALYDAILGITYLAFPGAVFECYEITPPNHMGYVQFPAALILVFALMFFHAARRPAANRDLIPYMILFKLAFAGVVFGYWLFGEIPGLWKPFAVADLIFAVLCFWAYGQLKTAPART